MSDETLGVADITEILRLLPHRYPFLLIDRVIDIRGEDHGIGIKSVTMRRTLPGTFPIIRSCPAS
jgi:3-hydroxyacyl-[acyl-carrier-protein] dehydratase